MHERELMKNGFKNIKIYKNDNNAIFYRNIGYNWIYNI